MLTTGKKAPEFRLKKSNGDEFSLSDLIGKRSVVLYFYPKDFTPGCTKEACSFRDAYEVFQEAGAEVIGVSTDSIESHQKFATKKELPFTLLSDPGGKVHKLYDVSPTLFGLLPGRVTYVIDKHGVIKNAFQSQLNINRHVNEALKVVQSLEG